MNTAFSLARIKFLFVRYFVERWRNDLRDFVMLFALSALFSFNAAPAGFAFFIFLLFSMLSASKTFALFRNKARGLDYLLIPAHSLEKSFTGIVLSHLYHPLLYFAAYLSGVKSGSLLYSFYPYHNQDVLGFESIFPDFQGYEMGIFLLYFFSRLALFTFASLFFQKSAFIKTCLCAFAFMLVLLFLLSLIPFPESHNIPYEIYLTNYKFSFPNMTFLGKMIVLGLPLFFLLFWWGMSFLRLKEKEV